jgi:hypothetical protein
MKYLLLFACVTLSSHSMAQTGPLVEYKDGPRKLARLFGDAYMDNLMKAYDPEPDTNVQFFAVLFSVDSSGKVGERIIVTTVGDTTKIPAVAVIAAIRKTNGMWINHTSQTIWVEQSFSHRYKDPSKPQLLLPSRIDVYEKESMDHPRDFVRLEPIPCESYGPIGDHKLATDAIKLKN